MIISVTEVVNTYSQQEDDMITMAEIARLTGVSQPTVSRVLNGNKTVNPEISFVLLPTRLCAITFG